jgi:hypothetical protein
MFKILSRYEDFLFFRTYHLFHAADSSCSQHSTAAFELNAHVLTLQLF